MRSGPGAPMDAALVTQLVTFFVDRHEYAIDIMRIKEIIQPLPITPVPRAPAFIEGVVELRGAILPVVDLRKRFELAVAPPTRTTKYVVVSVEGRIVALVVDRLGDKLQVAATDVKPPPAMVENQDARYFSGVCHHAGRIIMVLDIDRILSSQEKISLQGMAGA